MEQPRKELYKKLNSEGAYSKSYEEFEQQFSAPEKQEALYQKLNADGKYTKSKEEFVSRFFSEPVKKKDGTKSPSTSTTQPVNTESAQKDGSLDIGEKPKFELTKEQINQSVNKKPQIGTKKSEETLKKVIQREAESGEFQAKVNQKLANYRQSTKVLPEERAEVLDELNAKKEKKGFLNGLQSGLKEGWNAFVDVIGVGGSEETKNTWKADLDPFADEKKEATQYFAENKIKPTPEQVQAKVDELFINKKLVAKKQEKINQYLGDLDTNEKIYLQADAQERFSSIPQERKEITDRIAMNEKAFTQLLEESKQPMTSEDKSLVESELLKIGKYLDEDYKVVNKLTKNLGTAQDELDMFKRNYKALDNVANRVATSIADAGIGVVSGIDYVTQYTNPIGAEARTMKVQEGVEKAREFVQETRERFRPDNEEITLDNFGQYAVDLLANQSGTLLAIGTTGGVGGASILGLGQAGQTYSEMYKENKKSAKYSPAQMAFAPLVSGVSTGVLSSLPTAQTLKNAGNVWKSMLKNEATKELTDQAIKNTSRNLLSQIGRDISKETSTELLDNTIQNAVKKDMLGEKVGYFDNSWKVIKDTALLTGFLNTGALPQVTMSAVKMFTPSELNKVLDSNGAKIIELSKQLDNINLDDNAKKLVENQISELTKSSTKIIDNTMKKIDGLTEDEVKKVVQYESKKEKVANQAQEVKDNPELNDNTKKVILEGLSNEYKNAVEKSNEIVNAEIQKPTTEKVEITQPQAEVQETEQEVKSDFSKKSIDELEKRQSELEGAKSFTKESKEFREIDKELEKREWQSVLNESIENIPNVVDGLMEKEKEMPNGFGSYIDKRDARETKDVAKKYSEDVSKTNAKKDFKDAFFGNPDNWYADALKLRESVRVFTEKGGSFKELLRGIQKEFEQDGFSEEDAAGVIKNKLDKISKVNESTPTTNTSTDGSIRPTVSENADLAIAEKPTTEVTETEVVESAVEPIASKGDNKVDKIKVYRGEPTNVDVENKDIMWVTPNKELANEYSYDLGIGKKGTLEKGNVTETEIEAPKNPLVLNYKGDTEVRGKDIGGGLRIALKEAYKSGKVSVEKARDISKKISEYEELAGDNLEAWHTKINKTSVTKAFVEIAKDLGFDGIQTNEGRKGEFVGYGLFKESTDDISNKSKSKVKKYKLSTNGQAFNVERKNGILQVTNSQGKPVSKPTERAVLRKHADSIDFTQGKKASESEKFTPSEEFISDQIIDLSENPAEIAAEIEYLSYKDPREMSVAERKSYKEQIIADEMTAIKEEGFFNQNDRNNLENVEKTRKAYFSEEGRGIDELAQEISEQAGITIEPEDIADFIVKYPLGKKERLKTFKGEMSQEQITKSNKVEDLKKKFTQITGLEAKQEFLLKALEQSNRKSILNSVLDQMTDEEFAELDKTINQIEQETYEKNEQAPKGDNQSKGDKVGREKSGIQKEPNGKEPKNKPLEEKEFFKKYKGVHKDARSLSESDKKNTSEKIKSEGFNEGYNVNVLPLYKGVELEDNQTSKWYKYKKGDVIYLLPKEGYKNGANGYMTKKGYIPSDTDVVTIQYDGQSAYEAYKSQFKKSEPTRKEEVVAIYHGGEIKSVEDINNEAYFSTDKKQAEEYAKGNNGKVQKFTINKSDIANEKDAMLVINELGLESKEEGWDVNDLNIYELIDTRFETSLSDSDKKTLFKELKKRGFKAFEFLDMNLITLKNDIKNIVVLDKSILSENKKPTETRKEQRKQAVNASIDELANSAKALESIFGIKIKADFGDGKAQGTSRDQLIDFIATTAKAIANTGIEIDEAIRTVIAELRKSFDVDIELGEVKKVIDNEVEEAPRETFVAEKGKHSVLKRLSKGENPQREIDAINKADFNYDVRNQEKVNREAENFVKDVGIAEAYNAVKSGKIQKFDTAALIYNAILQRMPAEHDALIAEMTNEEDIMRAEEAYANEFAQVSKDFSVLLTSLGQGVSVMNYIYNKNEAIRYDLGKQVQNYKDRNKGVIPKDVEEKYQKASKRLEEVNELIKKKEQELADLENTVLVEEIEKAIKREKQISSKQKAPLTESEQKRKKELSRKFFGQLNDVTRFAVIIADPEFREYLGLSFKEVKGDLANFTNKIAKEIGSGAKQFIDEMFKVASEVNEQSQTDSIKISQDGKIRVPKAVIESLIEKGFKDINSISEQVLKLLQDKHPELSLRQIKESIVGYGRNVAKTRSDIEIEIGRLKRVGQLELEIEDLENGIRKIKNENKQVVQSSKIQDLRAKKRQLEDDLGITEEKRTERTKGYTKRRIAELKKRISEGDFSKREVKPVKQDAELRKLRMEKLELQEIFAKEQYKLELKNRSKGRKLFDSIFDILNLKRVGLTTGEFSPMFVQGGALTVRNILRNPKRFLSDFKNMFKAIASVEYYKQTEQDIKSSDIFDIIRDAKLGIVETDTKQSAKEELFQHQILESVFDYGAEQVGKLVKGQLTEKYGEKRAEEIANNVEKITKDYILILRPFERANNSYMNSLRYNRFKEGVKMLEAEGKNPIDNLEDYKRVASAINTLTGRSNLGALEQYKQGLGLLFFSAKLMASTWQKINPMHYWALRDSENWKKPSVAQKMLFVDALTHYAFMSSMTLLSMTIYNALKGDDDEEATVELNPKSSDFMKFKVGDVRLDYFGTGLAPFVLFSRLYTEEVMNSDGEIKKMGESGTKTRGEYLGNYFVNKLNPLTAGGYKYVNTAEKEFEGETFREDDWGRDFDYVQYMTDVMPIIYGTGKEVLEEQPNLFGSLIMIQAAFGVNPSVYGNEDKGIKNEPDLDKEGNPREKSGEGGKRPSRPSAPKRPSRP